MSATAMLPPGTGSSISKESVPGSAAVTVGTLSLARLKTIAQQYLVPTRRILGGVALLFVVTSICFAVYAHAEKYNNVLSDGMKSALCVAGCLGGLVTMGLVFQWFTSSNATRSMQKDGTLNVDSDR
jgi:hypothetical protein